MPFNKGCLQLKGEHDGEVIHVNRYDYQGMLQNQKIDIISIRPERGKVIIDFITKKTLARGCKEFKDLGPQRNKIIKG